MSIVLTCGQGSEYMRAHKTLVAAGLMEAMPSKYEQYSPADISRAICESYKIDLTDPAAISQIEPGKVWQALSGDLMLANLNRHDWGWADPNTIYLLNYWRDYDPLLKFVLTYSSPEHAVVELLAKEAPTSEAVEQVLAIWGAVNSGLLRFYSANKDRAILVNSSAISKDSGRFIGLARGRLDVDLPNSPRASIDAKKTGIPDLLASLLIEGALDAQSLYQELESAADMPGYTNQAQELLAYKAWGQYQDHKVQLEEASANSKKIKIVCDEQKQRVEQHQAEIVRLHQQKDEVDQKLNREAVELQGRIDQLSVGRNEQKQENELLLLQLHQVQEELEQVFLKSRENDKSQQLQQQQIRTDADVRQQLEADNRQLNAQIKTYKSTSDKQEVNNTELTKLNARVDEQGKENELLLLQLHQVQEELEHYFLKYQEVTQPGKQTASEEKAAIEEKIPATAGATDVVIDMRHFIDGDNWYYAEHDGRWAGPGKNSTLRLPKLDKGRYRLELDFVDAIAPDIIRNMNISLDGKPLKIKSGDGQIGPWASVITLYKKKLKYPLLLVSQIQIGADEIGKDHILEFSFPKTISPASWGDDDMRELAVRLRQVKLSRK